MSCENESNRMVVLNYFDVAFCHKDPIRAAMQYLHEEYVHHGHGSGSKREDFVLFFQEFFRSRPNFKAEVLHSLSDGQFVALRVSTKDAETSEQKMVAEFYRLEGGKIREHWHVVKI